MNKILLVLLLAGSTIFTIEVTDTVKYQAEDIYGDRASRVIE